MADDDNDPHATGAGGPARSRLPASPRVAGQTFAKVDAATVRMRTRKPIWVAGAGVKLSFCEADNPDFEAGRRESGANPRRVRVARNANESPLVYLEARGTIDARQARAGHYVRILHERLTIGTGSASFLRERVDGGTPSDGLTDRRAAAAIQLGKLADAIGVEAFRLLVQVCGDGRSLNDLTREAACRKGALREELRSALDMAAEFMGLGGATR